MIVTANKIPVPDPIAPMKSAKMVRDPIQTPPKAAATGMYFLKTESIPDSLCPYNIRSYSLSYLATSLGDDPETSIQVLEKIPQVNITKKQ